MKLSRAVVDAMAAQLESKVEWLTPEAAAERRRARKVVWTSETPPHQWDDPDDPSWAQ